VTEPVTVGLTYDLREVYLAMGLSEETTAEFDQGGTIDAIEAALVRLGHHVDRIGNVRDLVGRLAVGDQWDLVFNIAEGLHGVGREAQVPALLDAYGIPYTFADPLCAALTLHKGLTKRVWRDHGLPTTPFVEVAAEDDLDIVSLAYPLFVKPVAEGTAKGIDGRSRVDRPEDLAACCRHIWATFHQPALVEPYLPGREFTVGLLGTGAAAFAVGTLEIELLDAAEPHGYTYRNKEECEALCRYTLAPEPWRSQAEALALPAWRAVGGRDGGRVDLRAGADGALQLIEVNPLSGLHPSHSDLPMICTAVGMPYDDLIDHIVRSALIRGESPVVQRSTTGR
jgi:D-alanine-D-alanine ligase